MSKKLLRSQAIYAAQNGLAAGLFMILFTAEAAAYLLYFHPTVEAFWRISLMANRLAGPILIVGDSVMQTPFLLLTVLAVAVLVPLISYKHRSWLGTAASGHIALGIGVMISFNALRDVNYKHRLASLSDVFDPSIMSPSAASMCAVTLIMAGLCVLNHFMFFARLKHR